MIAHDARAMAGLAAALPFPPLARFRFHFAAQDPIRLPDYLGSVWRGLLGLGLRRTACVTRQPTCTGCLLVQSCVYSTLFETPGTDGEGFSALPPPFVLDIDPGAPRQLAPGAPFTLTIHLIGAAIAQAPYLVHALGIAGTLGLGKTRGRFTLEGVDCQPSPGAGGWVPVYVARDGVYHPQPPGPFQVPPAPAVLRLHFVTPYASSATATSSAPAPLPPPIWSSPSTVGCACSPACKAALPTASTSTRPPAPPPTCASSPRDSSGTTGPATPPVRTR